MPSATETAQAGARQTDLSPDEALFLQGVPSAFLAAVVRGEVNVVQLAREELAARGHDLKGLWVGPKAAAALVSATEGHVDAFAAEEQARVKAFRCRWYQAHAINPEHYPLQLPAENVGAWHEMLDDFDAQAPFDLPEPPGTDRRRRTP